MSRKDVELALAGIPAKDRLAIELACFRGFSCSQIAEVMRESRSAIQRRLRRGLHALGDTLIGETVGLPREIDEFER